VPLEPVEPTATQVAELLQDTAPRAVPLDSVVLTHDELVVGLVETRTVPTLVTATQRLVDEQETAVIGVVRPSTCVCTAHGGDPGAVEVSTSPELSTATHSAVDGHEIALIGVVPSIAVSSVQAVVVGVAVAYASPCLSVATHSVVDGHETPVRCGVPAAICPGAVQPPVDGEVVEKSWPASSTATQREVETQLRAVMPSVPGSESDRWGAVHVNVAWACAAVAPIANTQATTARARTARRAWVSLTMVVISGVVMPVPGAVYLQPVANAIGAAKG